MKKTSRILLCLVLLVTYVPWLHVVSAANEADTGQARTILINDDYEGGPLGALPEGYTTPNGSGVISAFSAANNTTVIHNGSLTNSYGNTSAAVTNNDSGVLWINDGAGRGGFNKAFAPVTAESKRGITAELRFMQSARVGDSYVLELLDSNKKIAVSFNINASPVTIDAKTWYTVKYVADVSANTADLYINGAYSGSVAFSTPVTDIASVNFRMAGSSTGQAYVDDLTVYRQDVTTPQNLTAEGANERAELSWNAASGAESYNVYRSTAPDGTYTLAAGGVPTNSYSDTAGLTNNTYYYYKVTAVNAGGESDASNTAAAFPNNVPAPSAEITGLKAVVRDGQLTIAWNPVEGATYYTLERSTNPAGPFTPLLVNGKPKIEGTSYLDVGLNAQTKYYYRLAAGNVGGVGTPKLLEQVSPAAPLQAPTLLGAEAAEDGVELVWSASAGAASYAVKRSDVSGGPYTTVGTVNGTSHTDGTAIQGRTYYYVVTAADEHQESRISNQLRVKAAARAAGAPAKPTGLTAAAGDGSVTLSWNTVSGATYYNVKRTDAANGAYTTLSTTMEATYLDAAVANGTTYYFTVSAVNENGESLDGDEIAVLPAKVLTVDKNAAADGVKVFNTIQTAVDSIPADNRIRTVISIAPGAYTEKLKIFKPYVSLVGAGMDVTTIVYGDYAGTSATTGKPGHTGSTFLSQTVEVNAEHFTAANLTIENSSGPRTEVAQAVALSLKSDMAVFESVRLKGYQDTLYNGIYGKDQGRHYFHNSVIEGDVDFIFGEAPAVVMDNVKMVLVSHTGGGGHITAGAQKNVTDKGYLFLNSQVVDDASASGSYDLGRPWKDYARVSFVNTFIDSRKFLPGGWVAACAGTCKTSYFSEYNSYGTGANAGARSIAVQLTGAEASVTVPSMLGGWDPSVPVFMPQVNYVPAVSAAYAAFDKNEAHQNDLYVTVRNSARHTLTRVTNGDTELDASAYEAAGSGYVIKKGYLAALPEGTAQLTFHYGEVASTLRVHIFNSGAAELGREVLPANDGWASHTTGTTGGAAANSDNIFVVTNRSELVKAAAGNLPKIIYVKGTIDMNVDDSNNPVGREFYEDPGYDFEEYLKTYDPAGAWGRNTPSGPLEEARAKSAANQGSRIKVTVGSNTTIVGLPDSGARILGGSLNLDKVDNIIIRNIEFENTFDHFPQWDPTDGESGNWNSAYDSISVKGSTHVWIDHNVFSDVGGLDDPAHTYFGRKYQQHDGTVDITNASDLVTVSYNHFHDHDKTSLIGGSDEAAGDAGKLRVTLHHNYYENAGQRVPRVRFGQVHVYNNFYKGSFTHPNNPYVYSLGVGYESQMYAQNNYFVNDLDTEPGALLQVSKGKRFTDTGTMLNGVNVSIAGSHPELLPVEWKPTLAVAVDETASVPAIVTAQAGILGKGISADTEAPTWPDGSRLQTPLVGPSDLTLAWSAAFDNKAVTGYKLYTAAGSTYTELASFVTGVTYRVTGLQSDTAYTFTLKAVDAAGNWSEYGPSVTVRTAPGSQGGGGSTGDGDNDGDDGDSGNSGSSGNAGSSNGSAGNSSGNNGNNGNNNNNGNNGKPKSADLKDSHKESVENGTVTVTVDAVKAAKQIADAAADTQVFRIEVAAAGSVVRAEVTPELIQALSAKNGAALLQIASASGSYSLPAKLFDTASIAAQHGASEQDVKIYVVIAKVEGPETEGAESAAAKLGADVIAPMVSFETIIEVKGKRESVNAFPMYVERAVKLQGAVDPKSAAGVMYDPQTQTLVPVPTVFQGAEAVMHRQGNSLYTVIDLPKTFGDLTGHWAQTDVETLASKLIVTGVSDSQFAPDQQVTRAEFAALLVRALGLTAEPAAGFSDVAAGDWFASAVGAAQRAKLISGFEDGTFRPQAAITREQMAAMVIRALELGGQQAQGDVQRLETFQDRADISGWAQQAAAQALSAGIIQGTTAERFAPQDQATRAQAVTMLKRTLQRLNFINP